MYKTILGESKGRTSHFDQAQSTGSCLNCGHHVHVRFCSYCGQDNSVKRISFRRLARHLADDLFRLESPLLRTAVELTYRPGVVARNYINGRRRCYTNPLKYCLLVGALYGIMYLLWAPPLVQLDWVEAEGPMPPWWIIFDDSHDGYLDHLGHYLDRHTAIFNLVLIPLAALLSKLFFFRERLNFSEHMVLLLYVSAQATIVTLPLLAYAEKSDWAVAGALGIFLALWLTACQQFFTGGTVAKQFRGLLAAGSIFTILIMATFAAAWLVLLYFWHFHGLVPG